jgi:RND family efflux transporter MFP subunit
MNTENPGSVDKGETSASPATEAPAARWRQLADRLLPQLKRFVSRAGRRLDWRIAVVLLAGLMAIAIWRTVSGHAKETELAAAAARASRLPTVPVASVVRKDLYNEVSIPAEFRPYVEVELHAKVSGYVKEMNVDFGDQVKSNQLLATLEVPELGDELNRALAAQKRAEADYRDAHLIYSRLQAVNQEHPNLVAQQDLDTAEAKDHTTEAIIAGAKAEVQRYQTLLAYTRITAPFDGVVTHRYVDPGALIQAGTTSETQSLPLVRVSDNYRLRLDFPVSVAYVKDIRVGDPVEVRVESLGNKSFTGTITRATLRVNEDTRTMMTEIEVPNPDLKLVPGMYAEVVLKVQRRPQVLAIPIEAVPPGQTSSVYVINDQSQIEERPVSLGLDTPTQYEVTAGLKEGELVLLGSRSQVHPGQKVEAKLIGPLAQQ